MVSVMNLHYLVLEMRMIERDGLCFNLAPGGVYVLDGITEQGYIDKQLKGQTVLIRLTCTSKWTVGEFPD